MLKCAFTALYLLQVWMDFDQTCVDVLLGGGRERLDFGDTDTPSPPLPPRSRSHKDLE